MDRYKFVKQKPTKLNCEQFKTILYEKEEY